MSVAPMAAVGSVSENEAYLGHRLTYRDRVDEKLSGLVTPRELLFFAFRGVMLAFISYVLLTLLTLVLYLLGSDSSSSFGFGSGYSSGPAMYGAYLLVFGPPLIFLASFFVPHHEGLSEWELLLDGKAASADSAYAAVYGTLTGRKIPVTTSMRRFRTTGDSAVNNFLVVRDGTTVAYVSVFAYGTGLFLGWSLWRKRSPFRMLLRFIADQIGAMFGRQEYFTGVIGSGRTRALREAVHSAVREGVDAANHNLAISLATTFGHDVPVETLGGTSTAAAPPRPLAAPTAGPASAPRPPAPPAAPMSPAVPAPPTVPVPPAPPVPHAWTGPTTESVTS